MVLQAYLISSALSPSAGADSDELLKKGSVTSEQRLRWQLLAASDLAEVHGEELRRMLSHGALDLRLQPHDGSVVFHGGDRSPLNMIHPIVPAHAVLGRLVRGSFYDHAARHFIPQQPPTIRASSS
jgi:hypothetical protein